MFLCHIKIKTMKNLFIISFLFIPILGYTQGIDIEKIKQIPITKDSFLNMQIENYAYSEKTIEEGGFYDKADIYWVCSIPMESDTISVYLFTMPGNTSAVDWKIALKGESNLSFYSYDICLYRLVYDLSSIATRESSITSSSIIHAIYTILSYCSDFYNETKYEVAGNDEYGYSISSWFHIFKKKNFDFHNQCYIKAEKKYAPTSKLKLTNVKDECLLPISIDNWLKKTYGASDIGYKLYKVIDLGSYKSIYLLETKHSGKRFFDFIFQSDDTLSFYLIDELFIPLAFKLKNFIGEKKEDELFKALECLCLSYMYQSGSCSPFVYR